MERIPEINFSKEVHYIEFLLQIYNERFEEEKAGYNIKMEVYRKQKDAADQNLNSLHNSPESLNHLTSSLGNNFDYEDSFEC